jgi:hypothetical protein
MIIKGYINYRHMQKPNIEGEQSSKGYVLNKRNHIEHKKYEEDGQSEIVPCPHALGHYIYVQ